ncbi:hypothetical protein [Ruegeria atlantica]|uniref:hypothetical protein n=1 Tax=Ruegeria atlantica TaxID=81569 RepID=UPI00147A2D3C|nr:hypothetical protein [Ruegeria atlantica]
MKTIIHIGMPKTGSTALQKALCGARKELAKNSVLYPIQGKQVNHGLLAGAVRPYEVAPRRFRRFSEQELNSRVKVFLENLNSQILGHDSDLLILSSEYLWPVGQNQAGLEKLGFLLKQAGIENPEFVAYVRGPSSYYLSATQQRLRASSTFRQPGNYNITANLDAYSEFFSNSKFSVRLFNREALVGGDIISDFMSLHRPDLQGIVSKAAKKISTNESLSAEGMVLMQQFRRHFYANQDDRINKQTLRFINQLRRVEKRLNLPRPMLRPEVAEYTDYSGTGPLELRDRYGIVFPKLDYSRLERGEFAKKPQIGSDVQDVVQVSDERLEQMVRRLLQSYLSLNPTLRKWLRSLPLGKSA